MISALLLHYFSVTLCIILPCIGVAVGQAFTTRVSFDAINRQPKARDEISRTTLISLALIETSALIGFLGSILLFFETNNTFLSSICQLGFSFAIGIPALALGIASSFPAQAALMAIARQPFIGASIRNFMILTQSVIQTPLAFGLIVALLIRNQFSTVTNLSTSLALLSSGMCIGLGCIGPAFGVGRFTFMACKSTGINKKAYGKLFTFTLISQAIIETPVIFSAIISFWLIRIADKPLGIWFSMLYLAISFVMAIGTLGPGLSSGKTAAAACKQIALNTQIYPSLSRTSLIAQGIIDTSAIYAFIVALTLILIL